MQHLQRPKGQCLQALQLHTSTTSLELFVSRQLVLGCSYPKLTRHLDRGFKAHETYTMSSYDHQTYVSLENIHSCERADRKLLMRE